jgi:mono/diheme cytochrome c family protein
MSKFILGVVLTLVVLAIGGLVIAMLGFVPTHADATPPKWEHRLANTALDASVERHAPRVSNPVPPTDDNLIDGMKLYTMNCAGCHGTLDGKPNTFGASFYPPAPNLILDPLDDPEWRIFYVVRTGVRYTGMPSWSKTLSEQEMWKATAFLARIEKLPPAVQDYWKKAFGAGPAAASSEREEHEPRHEP